MKNLMMAILAGAALVSAAGVQADDSAAASQPAVSTKSVPQLAVSADCSSCAEFSAALQSKVVAAYDEAAKADGAEVKTDSVAQLKVSDFNKRSGGARFMGVLGGKDWIKGEVVYGNATSEVEDNARSSLFGIETVAENVGKQAYKNLAAQANSGADQAN